MLRTESRRNWTHALVTPSKNRHSLPPILISRSNDCLPVRVLALFRMLVK